MPSAILLSTNATQSSTLGAQTNEYRPSLLRAMMRNSPAPAPAPHTEDIWTCACKLRSFLRRLLWFRCVVRSSVLSTSYLENKTNNITYVDGMVSLILSRGKLKSTCHRTCYCYLSAFETMMAKESNEIVVEHHLILDWPSTTLNLKICP